MLLVKFFVLFNESKNLKIWHYEVFCVATNTYGQSIETKIIKPLTSFNAPGAPRKKYSDLASKLKSADFSNRDIFHPSRSMYKKSNSVDENLISGNIYSENTAFEIKSRTYLFNALTIRTL